jgi:hypothetical protein
MHDVPVWSSILRAWVRASLALVALEGSATAQDWANPSEGSPPAAAEPAPPPADDATPHEATGLDVELGGVVSYVTPPIRGGTNPFGAGLGGRVGLVYSGFYVGITVLDYVGGSDVDVSYQAIFYGLEVGYGWRLPVLQGPSLTLRPVLGIGDAAVSYTDPALAADVVTSASGSSSSSDTLTVNNVYVEPALMLMLSSGHYFGAVRGSALVIPGIQYSGADPTTWLCYGTRLELGFVF